MEWWLYFIFIFGGLLILMATGLPTAFCFMLINLIGVYLFWGGVSGLNQLIIGLLSNLTQFVLLPLILYILMGSVLFESGIASRMIEAISKSLGRIPGRLSLLAVMAGTLFATLSGSSMASTAVLGTALVPEMEKYGYKKTMSLGPIMGSGGLAILIPPSSLGVLLAIIAQVSVGKLLIAIVIPGILLAFVMAIYILGRCWLQPSLAPPYDVSQYPISEKISDIAKYVLPLAFIIFLVTGVIFLGIATPSEAAATGCVGCFILAAAYGKLNWRILKISTESSVQTAVMVLIIMASAVIFSQVISYTQASQGMMGALLSLPLSPTVIIIGMQIIVLILGCFMDSGSILFITLPVFMPIINSLSLDPVWFSVLMLLNIEMGQTTPPFGMVLFVMKGAAPSNTTMADIIRSAVPFLILNVMVMALLIAFPILTQWLPGMMIH